MEAIINMFKKNLTLKDYADLFNAWNVDRCADGAENSFDLDDFGDYSLFNITYGLETTFKCMKLQRFWIGGTNFKKPKPFPTDVESAKELMSKLIDIETIYNRKDIYGKYFNIDFYAPNYEHLKELEYPVVLQHFTTYWWELVVRSKAYSPFKEDVSKNDILDMVANIAYDFYLTYKNTKWATSFDDYALHYIVRLLKERSDIFIDIIDDCDYIIHFFTKVIGGYYSSTEE